MARIHFLGAMCLLLALSFSAFPVHGFPAWGSLFGENRPKYGNIDEQGIYFEGDIVLPPGGKAGIDGEKYRWVNAVMPYTIAPSFTGAQAKLIRSALDEIQNKTCMKFVVRTNEEDYVQVQNSDNGCYAYVGRQGGRQNLNLGFGCVYYGIIQHEFIHTSGFYHEQSRSDRDTYVRIIWGNILFWYWPQFFTQDNDRNFSVPYDYGSIMHYSKTAFSWNGGRTIETKPKKDVPIGQRDGVSTLDVLKINRMYKCPGRE